MRECLGVLAGAVLIGSGVGVSLHAQGISGASLRGTVRTSTGEPVAGSSVVVITGGTGARQGRVTGVRGSFSFENLAIGAYAVEVRALGYAPHSSGPVTLHLGDRLTLDLVLAPQARQLGALVVRAASLRDPGSGGPAYAIPGDAIRNLPLLNRNFTGLFGMAAQATGATNLSISGQHFKLNGIQVDGGTSGDFFGVNVTPGASTGAKSISLEAIEEVRVLVAPFDVRQGGFTGGLINAVTRSGTNEHRATLFVSHARPELVGSDTAGLRGEDFNVLQYGASVGGPLVVNRLHYFLVADVQTQRSTYSGGASIREAGFTDSSAQLASEIFRTRYGFDAGNAEAPVLTQPDRNLFFKMSWNPSQSHALSISHTMVNASKSNFDRVNRTNNSRDGWQLSNSGSAQRNRTSMTRLTATSLFGAVSNEAIASVGRVDDSNMSTNRVPLFLVRADTMASYLAGGSVKSAQDTRTTQQVVELTDNLSWSRGTHLLTAGAQTQFLQFADNFFLGSWGTWTFANLDALAAGTPGRYELAIGSPGGVLAKHTPIQVAGYVQDRWDATRRLVLTGGVRYDVPFLDSPKRNDALAGRLALDSLDTSVFPSGNGTFSPRVGFAYVAGSRRSTMVRGGVGAFAGRTPYVLLSSAFVNTGNEQYTLVCDAAGDVPAPTPDITSLPTQCLTPRPFRPSVTVFARSFRFPQAVKYALGVDQDLGHGASLSLDIVHAITRNSTYFQDVNLVERGTSSEQRLMYGTIASRSTGTGPASATPARKDTALTAVFLFDNRTADRATSITAVLNKRWNPNAFLEIGYSWSRTQDVTSLFGNNGPIIGNLNPLDGTQRQRRLSRSARDIPHNLVITAVAPLYFGLTSAFFFRARSGTPFGYSVLGDANADGSGNDLVYVPTDASNISLASPAAFATLDALIESETCLRKQRGRVMSRNSCRNASVRRLDVRLGKQLGLNGHRRLELTTDIFNLPNLLNRKWGIYRQTSSNESAQLLRVDGWDPLANRPRYTVQTVNRNAAVIDLSRWRMQIGARIDF